MIVMAVMTGGGGGGNQFHTLIALGMIIKLRVMYQ
jgi:hypothetical protein